MTSRSSNPAATMTFRTVGRPTVSVPVLSKMTTSTAAAFSSAAALRMRIPVSAARPVPTMTAVGVARPIAHGQAMMTTAMNAVRASVSRGSGPATNQIRNVMLAVTSTNGTKISLIRSARCWIGAFEPWARSTIATIEARTVSRPTRVARMTTDPVAFIVAPMSSSPGRLATGSGSPVSIDSSIAV